MVYLFSNPLKILRYLLGVYYTWKYVDGGKGRIRIADKPAKLKITKKMGSRFILDGVLNISSFLVKSNEKVLISIGPEATLEIKGDFNIGNGTKVILYEQSVLRIGGKKNDSGSGITERAHIMVQKKIDIGVDFICSWNVFITDSDLHEINNTETQGDVIIGDKVWVTPNCSILKGTKIGHDCIIANGTVICDMEFPNNSLIGGNPPKVLKDGVSWRR